MSKLRIENGVIVGTSGSKYDSKNPISRLLIRGFDNSIFKLLNQVSAQVVVEVGCGEGHVTKILLRQNYKSILATDISESVLEEAQIAIQDRRVLFQQASLEKLSLGKKPDLVVCCEVLEHLDDPVAGLNALASLNADYLLLSVPREPIWRLLNMLRGAYLKDYGNSPGHIQHWSKSSFIRFISVYFDVIEVSSPLPWTMVLCRPKS